MDVSNLNVNRIVFEVTLFLLGTICGYQLAVKKVKNKIREITLKLKKGEVI